MVYAQVDETMQRPTTAGVKRPRRINDIMPHMFDHLSSAPIAVIDQITFGLLNPEHLVAISACEVTEFTLYKKQLPAKNSPNDTMMGPCDNNTVCGTCSEGIATCPMHMGYMKLQFECYTPPWIKQTKHALCSVCFHCSKLLLNRKSSKFRAIARLRNENDRLNEFARLGKKVRRCGLYTHSQLLAWQARERELNEAAADISADASTKKGKRKRATASKKSTKKASTVTDGGDVVLPRTVDLLEQADRGESCGCHGEQYDYKHDNIRIWYAPRITKPSRARSKAKPATATGAGDTLPPDTMTETATQQREWKPLSARVARNILKHISDEDARLLGFDPVLSRPEWMIWTHFPVAPAGTRLPVMTVHGSKSRGEDDTTKKIKDVAKMNRTLKQVKEAVIELKRNGGDSSKLSNPSAAVRALGIKTKPSTPISTGGTVTVNDQLLIKSLGKRGRATHQSSWMHDDEADGNDEADDTESVATAVSDADDEDYPEDEEEDESTQRKRKRKQVIESSLKEIEQQKRKKKKLHQKQKPVPEVQFAFRDNGVAVTHRPSEMEELERLLVPAEYDVYDWSEEEGTKEAVRQLQETVALWFRSDLPVKLPGQRSHANSKTIYSRYNGKQGRIRSNMLGKRVDFCARGVITPDPSLDVDQLGVPECVAVHLTMEERVRHYNIVELTKAVRNGPDVWPGARSIIKPDGTIIDLRYEDRYAVVLEYGWIVERHIRDDDHGVFNRQPSLHRMSMMAHRLKIMPGYTFRLNLSVCKPYNADFDGDAMCLHILQLLRAVMESEQLMYVNNQIVSPQNCKPIIAEVQDPVLGTWIVTGKDCLLSAEDFMRYLGQAKHRKTWTMPAPAVWKRNRRTHEWEAWYTGKQLFSALLPREFYMSQVPRQLELSADRTSTFFQIPTRSLTENAAEQGELKRAWHEACGDTHPADPEVQRMAERRKQLETEREALEKNVFLKWLRDECVVILNGRLCHGRIDSSMIGAASNSIVHRMIHEFNNDLTSEFLSDLQCVINTALMDIGVSVGISDCISPCDADVQRLLMKALPDIQDHPVLQKHAHDSDLVRSMKEQTTCTLLSDLRMTVAGLIQAALSDEKYLQQRNRLMKMVKAGSKGNVINIAQILGCLGQIIVEQKRPADEVRGRLMPHFEKHKTDVRASGWVSSNFAKGLTPTESYLHALGGREGLVNTSVTTSVTGYTNRKLTKSMESTGVKQDMTVRDSGNNIVDMSYGGDGFDAMWLLRLTLPTIPLSNDELRKHYGAVDALTNEQVWPIGSAMHTVVAQYRQQLAHVSSSSGPAADSKKRRVNRLVAAHGSTSGPPTPAQAAWTVEQQALELELAYIQQDRDRMRAQQLVYPGDECQTDIMVPVNVASLVESQAMLQHYQRRKAGAPASNPMGAAVYLLPSELVLLVHTFIRSLYRHYPSYHNELPHFEALLRCQLCTRNLLLRHQLTRDTITRILFLIEKRFVRALVSPGEMVGVVAAQSLGELLTQTSLNVFHTAGVGSQLSGQVSSLQAYINLGPTPTNPSMTIYLNPHASQFMPPAWVPPEAAALAQQQVADHLQQQLVSQYLEHFLSDERGADVVHEPVDAARTHPDHAWLQPYMDLVDQSELEHFSPYVIRYTIDVAKLCKRQVSWATLLERVQTFWNERDDLCLFVHSPLDRDTKQVVLRIYVSTLSRNYEQFEANREIGANQQKLIECLCHHMKRKIPVSGVSGISGASLVEQKQTVVSATTGELEKSSEWCIITVGSNLIDVLGLPWVDTHRTTTNHIREICEVFGIHAAGNALQRGITWNLTLNSSSVERRHIGLLVRTMVHRGYIVPLRRHGMNQLRDAGALQKASFEEPIPILNDAALHGETDPMAGTTENLMVGNTPPLGTGTVDVKLDEVPVQREIIERNEHHLSRSVLPDLTAMDLAVLVYNTGQQHSASYEKMKQQRQHQQKSVTPITGVQEQLLCTEHDQDQEWCGSDIHALLYPRSVHTGAASQGTIASNSEGGGTAQRISARTVLSHDSSTSAKRKRKALLLQEEEEDEELRSQQQHDTTTPTNDTEADGRARKQSHTIRAELSDDAFFAQLNQSRGTGRAASADGSGKARRDQTTPQLQLKRKKSKSVTNPLLHPLSRSIYVPPCAVPLDKQSAEYRAAQFVYQPVLFAC